MISALELCAGGNSERLQKPLASGRHKAETLVPGSKEMLRANQALGSVPPAFHPGVGQGLDVAEVTLAVGGADGGGNSNGESRGQKADGGETKAEAGKSHSG